MRRLSAACLLLMLAGCCDLPQTPPGFDAFVRELKREALASGIREETLDQAFNGVYFIERAVSKDRSQPEIKLTLDTYLEQRLSWLKVQRGRAVLADSHQQLEPIAARYGVPPAVVVGLWGLESSYGRNVGRYPLISSLTTLAFEGRRGDFFRKELMAALRILEQGHITPERMTASWAGAMGQAQFMPTSFEHYAADGDGDGHKDIWTNKTDVFASIANYLKENGWRPGMPWGVEVVLPKDFDATLLGRDQRRSVAQWQQLGVAALAEPLPDAELTTRLVAPDGPHGRVFLVTRNYNAFLAWNRSDYFALAIGLFTDQLSEP